MERLVEMKIAKFNILSIVIDCYYRLFHLIYISYDSEGFTIQGSCKERKILATTVISRDSFERYECRESMVIAVPLHLGKLGGRCVSIKVLMLMDRWTAGELRMYLSQATEFRTKLLVAICINYPIIPR